MLVNGRQMPTIEYVAPPKITNLVFRQATFSVRSFEIEPSQ